MSVKINEWVKDFILIFKSLFPFLLKNTRERVKGFKVVLCRDGRLRINEI